MTSRSMGHWLWPVVAVPDAPGTDLLRDVRDAINAAKQLPNAAQVLEDMRVFMAIFGHPDSK